MNKIHHVAVTAWMGMTVRNLYFGPVFEQLHQNFQLTLFSYYASQLEDILSIEGNDVYLKQLRVPRWRLPQVHGRLTDILYEWNYYAFWRRHHPVIISDWIRPVREDNPVRYFFNNLGGMVVSNLRYLFETDWLRDFVYLFPIQSQFKNVDVLLTGTTKLPKDQQLVYTAKRSGVPVISLVHSWDNLTSKGLLSAIPDRLLVWNEVMASEAETFHGIPRDRVDVVGVPQHELYRRLAKITKAQTFRKRLDIPDDCRVVTYAACAEIMFPDEPHFIELLVETFLAKSFGNAILVIRLQPPDIRRDIYDEKYLGRDLPVRFDYSDSGFAAENTWEIGDQRSITNFVELLQFSDVLINIASTMTLDAVLFDTPVLCLNFNLLPENAWNAAHRHHQYPHFTHVINSGAVTQVDNMSELINGINHSIKDPGYKSSERENLRKILTPDLPTGLLISDSIQNTIEHFRT